MTRLVLISAALLLASCGKDAPPLQDNDNAGAALDERAIAVGILPDPEKVGFAGRFETRTDLGTDKFCAVGSGSDFTIGFLSISGPESKCEARGRAEIDSGKIRITLTGKGDCSFDANYDGIELRFPGALESGCASYCTPRASFSGTHYFLIESGDLAARKSLGRDFDRLCS